MSTIDENDSTATELGLSEDPATAMLAGELMVSAGSATVVWSARISSAADLGVGAGSANLVAAAFEEKF